MDDAALRLKALEIACSKHGLVDNLQSDVEDTNGRRQRLMDTVHVFYNFLSPPQSPSTGVTDIGQC